MPLVSFRLVASEVGAEAAGGGTGTCVLTLGPARTVLTLWAFFSNEENLHFFLLFLPLQLSQFLSALLPLSTQPTLSPSVHPRSIVRVHGSLVLIYVL